MINFVLLTIWYSVLKVIQLYKQLLITLLYPFQSIVKHCVIDQFNRIGITISSNKGNYDIIVKKEYFYRLVYVDKAFGFNDSYIEGWIEVKYLEKVLRQIIKSNNTIGLPSVFWTPVSCLEKILSLINIQELGRYDNQNLGNHYEEESKLCGRIYTDKYMVTSIALWNDKTTSVEEAQIAKLDQICSFLELEPGMNIVDIGCGYGGIAKYISENRDVFALGISTSVDQIKHGIKKYCTGNTKLELKVMDFSDISKNYPKKFNRIVLVEMLEHVGIPNLRNFFQLLSGLLLEDGIVVIQCYMTSNAGHNKYSWYDSYLHKYLEPGIAVPTLEDMAGAFGGIFLLKNIQCISNESRKKTWIAFRKNLEFHATKEEKESSIYRNFYLFQNKEIVDSDGKGIMSYLLCLQKL